MTASSATEQLDHPFPMVCVRHRTLPDDFQGPVFISDIDKTYLDTRFSQLRGLLKIPFELGIDKRSYPGMAALLRELRNGPGGREHRPLFFISASPPQLRKAIERKMLIDGVEFDGITFKDPLRLVLRRQFDQLREQVAFKISALLLLQRALPRGAQMVLFGDDAEKDALIYCLFADMAAGRLRDERLVATLQLNGVRSEYAEAIAQLAALTAPREAVAQLYIHLVRLPDGASIREFPPMVVGFSNPAAAAKHLVGAGHLTADQARHVLSETADAEPVCGEAALGAEGSRTPPRFLAPMAQVLGE